MNNVVLFGPPGAGKGTQSARLVSELGMVHLSTGNLFRVAIKNETPLGLKAKATMDQGRLVPDDIVVGLVEETIERFCEKPFIFDGFPRTVSQAESLQDLLQKKNQTLAKAIFIDVSQDIILKRLTGRRVCLGCGKNYHILFCPPKQEDICDQCSAEVSQRKDDMKSAIKIRIDAYEKNTAPLKVFYRDIGILGIVDGQDSVDRVFESIKALLSKIKKGVDSL